MSSEEIFLIATGLAMDSLAVSIAAGVILPKVGVKDGFKIPFFMGFFQAFMPLIGWLFGRRFHSYIADFDHWVAFAILSFLGGKMIYESLKRDILDNEPFDPTRLLTLLGLAVATSIDALAVGVSFACLRIEIKMPLIIIGTITFVLSYFGIFFGNRFGKRFDLKIELIGGIILIGIGSKILIEHLITSSQ